MIDVYSKAEKVDLDADQKKVLRKLSELYKQEIIQRYYQWLEDNSDDSAT